MSKELLYYIPAGLHTEEQLVHLLTSHPEIKFVSMVGIDLAGNDTDEKIPIGLFLKDVEKFFRGGAVETDGSSVVLTGLATLNNAKVDMVVDSNVNWFVDYNYDNYDEETDKPVGTLRIPAFLVHNGLRVDSRAILSQSMDYVKTEIISLLKKNPKVSGLEHLNVNEIEDIVFTVGTELEFWVKTPDETAEVEELSSTQVMQENYWARTRGQARTALEQAIEVLGCYGLEPEMGHKEVGGLKARIGDSGNLAHVVEQLEIDWRFTNAMQAADNELQARILIKEVFRANGFEVTFKAKPIIGVAGSGEHTHLGVAAKLKSGKLVNLFAPTDLKADFLSAVGFGAIMGILKNYEVINPFVSSTNDSLNRLKPGFEAPICIVTSLGNTPAVASRNRTVLAGLVRDTENPLATRFEVRAPNPFTNTYVAVASMYLSMLDGIKAAVNSGKTTKELEAELSKPAGTPGFYLETERAYRSEHDVFEDYSDAERNKMFGKPPATVWENMQGIANHADKVAVLTAGNAFRKELIDAFVAGAQLRWTTELVNRIIPGNCDIIRECYSLHDVEGNDLDEAVWKQVNDLRVYLGKDSLATKSLFTRIRDAVQAGDYKTASALQVEMDAKVEELKDVYNQYKRNIIEVC
ncbi:MAG: GlnA: glutamine synthetase, type [Firmicutes bacterium]|nr:GlnA: glutamine synthetase, type [Bacillota bacterium]